MAIDDVLSRISAIQARFDSAFGGTALFQGVASDAARHAGLGRDETPVLDPTGETVGTAGDDSVDDTIGTLDEATSGETVDAMVAAQLSAAASGGSSTLLDLTGSASDPADQLQLLASFIAQQQASAGIGGTGT